MRCNLLLSGFGKQGPQIRGWRRICCEKDFFAFEVRMWRAAEVRFVLVAEGGVEMGACGRAWRMCMMLTDHLLDLLIWDNISLVLIRLSFFSVLISRLSIPRIAGLRGLDVSRIGIETISKSASVSSRFKMPDPSASQSSRRNSICPVNLKVHFPCFLPCQYGVVRSK
jgi:hypothetical protein